MVRCIYQVKEVCKDRIIKALMNRGLSKTDAFFKYNYLSAEEHDELLEELWEEEKENE